MRQGGKKKDYMKMGVEKGEQRGGGKEEKVKSGMRMGRKKVGKGMKGKRTSQIMKG